MASESIAHEAAIVSEHIRARGIIVKYTVHQSHSFYQSMKTDIPAHVEKSGEHFFVIVLELYLKKKKNHMT